jgi:hypothetical protein
VSIYIELNVGIFNILLFLQTLSDQYEAGP